MLAQGSQLSHPKMALVERPICDNPALSRLTKHTAESTRAELWSEKDRQQQLLRFKIPEFISPYPLGVNKYEDTARKSTNDWLLEHGIDTLFRPEVFAKFVQQDTPGLTGKVYTDFGPQAFDWVTKFVSWVFTLDDLLDDTALGSKRGSTVPVLIELQLVLLWNFPDDPVLNDWLFKFLDEIPDSELREESLKLINNAVKKAKNLPGDNVYDGKLGPTASCLRDLWATCVRTMPEVYNLRLAIKIQSYFLGNLAEARNREDETIPTIQEYKFIRRKTVCIEASMVMVDLFEEVCLPDELFYSPQMQQLLAALSDIVAWHNDLFSFKKEFSRGDVHNLVALVSHERKHCSYEESALIALDMIYDRIPDLEKAFVGLLAIAPPAYENVVQRYIKTCRHWVSGSHAWHSACPRYQ